MDKLFHLGLVTFKNGSFENIIEMREDSEVLIVTTSKGTYMYKEKEKKFYTYECILQMYGDNKPLFAAPHWIENNIIQRITYFGHACCREGDKCIIQ